MASEQRRDLVRAKRYWAPRLRRLANVVGVGIGAELVGGDSTGRSCLRVYVERKVELGQLRPGDRIPERLPVPRGNGNGFEVEREVAVDVIDAGPIRAHGKVRPLKMGHECTREPPRFFRSGTMGAIVEDQHGRRYLLSNNHVLANLNRADTGDPVFQPDAMDSDRVGELARWVPLRRRGPNRVDAALARLGAVPERGTWVDGFGAVREVARRIPPNARVLLRGAAQRKERGRVVDHDWRGVIDYGRGGRMEFDDLFVIDALTSTGDSGALVFTRTRRALGLVIGGNALYTFCCPLLQTLMELEDPFQSTGPDQERLRLRLV